MIASDTHCLTPTNVIDPLPPGSFHVSPGSSRCGEPETSEVALPSDYSPDRVDALVFLITDLLLGSGGQATVSYPGSNPMGARNRGLPMRRR